MVNTNNLSFEDKILKYGERQNFEELQEVVKNTETENLIDAILKRLNGPEAISFWNYLLKGFTHTDESKDKRFVCVKALLKQLNKVDFTYKHTELIRRLCLDLPSFTNDQLVEIVEFCIDSIKIGDPKCTGWKELLPEAIDVISGQEEVILNGFRSTGANFRTSNVRYLCTMKWPLTVLTPLANMFRDMELTNDEISTILTKFCYSLQKLEPLELPTLAFQIFSLCKSASQIILPIMAINRYFHKYYYKKQFSAVEGDSTDFDSIDASVDHSEKELREAEETVLHHLGYCTQSKVTEQQMIQVLRGLSASPDVLLTPFVLSSLISMTKINRDPDSTLSTSVILSFLRNVVKNNEDEKELYKISAWCRDTFQVKQVDLEQIFTILIDQNKEGKDVVTPGLVNLAFILLKTKNSPKLNTLAIFFLQNFIKKRFIFGQGVVENLAEWMIVEQDETQYSECLTTLSLSDTFTMSECIKTIKNVLDFFLKISGENAMRMMTFILPVVKISHTIRDALIDVLKKAMYSRDPDTCRMGVFGFCMLLKQLNNNNSQRAALGTRGIFTQQSISGYSRSQATFSDRSNAQRHFDILTLEIVGLLRNCFHHNLKIKETLYESLTRAIELNPKLTPHVLKFIESHFIQYFELDESTNEIKFEKVVSTQGNENEIDVKDNLGRLTMFVASCVVTCDTHELEYDSVGIKDMLSTLIEKIISKDIELGELTGNLDHKSNQLAMQKLNLLEALMFYAIWTSKPNNENVKKVFALFKRHRAIRDGVKQIQSTQPKKSSKKAKEGNDTVGQTQNVTINGTVVKKVIFKPENIWDLSTLERFLRLLHEDVVSFASSDSAAVVKGNRDLVRYVLEVTSVQLESLRNQPSYKQVSHSKRIFRYLIEVTRVIYERCIKKLSDVWAKFDVSTAYLSAECLRQSMLTANEVFKKKFNVYLKEIDLPPGALEHIKITNIIQSTIESALADSEELHEEADGKKIAAVLIQSLEILYENIPWDDDLTVQGYNWMFKFCQNNELHMKDLGIAHKLLFSLRQKSKTGGFYDTVAMHLERVLGKIDDEVESNPQFEMKSITDATAESCVAQILVTVRKQIDQVEYFISKANNLHFKLKITVEDDHDTCVQQLKAMERSICSQLIHISNTLFHLTNVCIPIGPCVDALVRIVMVMFVCLTNLTKHFVARHSTIPMSMQGTKFDQLLRTAGKPLAKRVYNLISYIETNLFENNRKRKVTDPQMDRAKMLKETKFLPRLVLRIENFNKFVILLSKKTNSHLTHYLHFGTVRDFRIKTADLKEAIDQTIAHTSQIEVDESMLEPENERLSDDESSILGGLEKIQQVPTEGSDSSQSIFNREEAEESPPLTNSSQTGVIENESNVQTSAQILKNLAKINAKSKKRKSKQTAVQEEPEQKKKKGRGRPKKK